MSEFPDGFEWDEGEGRPVFHPPKRDVTADAERQVATIVPHLSRAEELLWNAGHPRVAQALHEEVVALGVRVVTAVDWVLAAEVAAASVVSPEETP